MHEAQKAFLENQLEAQKKAAKASEERYVLLEATYCQYQQRALAKEQSLSYDVRHLTVKLREVEAKAADDKAMLTAKVCGAALLHSAGVAVAAGFNSAPSLFCCQ